MTEQEIIINEFNLYLEKIKGIGSQARGNYLSWARFLMKTHDLTAIRTEDDVKRILDEEKRLMALPQRKVYKTVRDYGNFRSTLNRFLPFMQCYICKKMKLQTLVSMDEMIDLVAQQDCAARAQVISEAIRIVLFERNYTLNDLQKERLKTNLMNFGVTNNFFIQNFNPNSNAIVVNN